MIRTLFFADTPHRLAGAQRSLISILPALRDVGIDPLVVAPADGIFADACRAAEVRVRILHGPPAFSMFGRTLTRLALTYQAAAISRQIWQYARQLTRLIAEERTEVLHLNGVRGAVMTGLAAAMSGCNAVLHVRGFPDVAMPYWLAAQAIANRFVLVSHALVGELVPALRSRALVVHNGVDVERRIPRHIARRFAAERWVSSPLRGDAPIFLALCSVVPIKGLHHLLTAAAVARDRGVEAVYLVAGPTAGGAYDGWLRRRCEQLGLTDRVRFVGYVPDVHMLLCASDALILPSVQRERLRLDDGMVVESRCNEGFPRCVLEAMAAERPVIATRSGGIPEQVVDGVTGLLVPPGDPTALADAICRAARDPEWRHRAGACGGERVRTRFTVEAAARGLAEALHVARGETARIRRPVEYAAFCRDGLIELVRAAVA
jgi:glycosyltransferase involved in cell wall biosynthesis